MDQVNNNITYQQLEMNVRFQNHDENKCSAMSTAIQGSKINRLQDTGAYYANKIKQESDKLIQLEEQIRKNEIILEQKRKQIIQSKTNRNSMDPLYISKRIKNIEVNLVNSRNKHNETLARNRHLREEIDAFRKEKNIFKQIQDNLQLELKEKELEKKLITEKCENAVKELKNSHKLLSNAKIKNFKEQKDFEKQFQEVFKILDIENRDEKLKEMRQEAQRRKIDNNSFMFASKYMADTYLTQQVEENQENQSEQLQKQKTQQQIGKNTKKTSQKEDINNLENIKNEVQKYQDTFTHLQKETGKQTIAEIVDKFIEQEEQNFSLFNYINTQSDELESLERTKNGLLKQIQEIENPVVDKSDEKLKKVKKMKEEIQVFEDKYEKMKKIQQKLIKTMNALKIGIPNIFDKIGCNNKEYLEECGELLNVNDINETNILLFLGIIEKRTNEILQMYNQVYKQKKERKNTIDQESSSSLSQDLQQVQSDTNFHNNVKEKGQLYDLIDIYEEERTKVKNASDFKSTRWLDAKDFQKMAENDLEQIGQKKIQNKNQHKR